jgi:hypothetical protein
VLAAKKQGNFLFKNILYLQQEFYSKTLWVLKTGKTIANLQTFFSK